MRAVPNDPIALCNAPYPGDVEPVIAAGMEERELQADAGTVRYWASVSPSPDRGWIVFLPGLSADHTLFNPQFAHLAQRWNLVVWDAPGHGLSRPWGERLSLDDMAPRDSRSMRRGAPRPRRPVARWLRRSGLPRPFPAHATAFVSLDSSPMQRRYYKRWHLGVLRHMEGLCLLWGTGRFLRGQMARACSTTEHGRRNMLAQLGRYSRRELCALLGDGFRALVGAVAQDRAYQIDCPFMIVCGTEDAAGFVKTYDEAWSRQTGVPITWVEGAGHNSNVDDPAFVNSAIDRFLEPVAERRPQG